MTDRSDEGSDGNGDGGLIESHQPRKRRDSPATPPQRVNMQEIDTGGPNPDQTGQGETLQGNIQG